MYDALFKQPEWFMWGVDNEDGTITLIASRSVEDLTLYLAYEQQVVAEMGQAVLAFAKPVIESHAKTKEFEIIKASTYSEAFAELFQRWSK